MVRRVEPIPLLLIMMWVSPTSGEATSGEEATHFDMRDVLEQGLDAIAEVSSKPDVCLPPSSTGYRSIRVPFDPSTFRGTRQKADLIARFLQDSGAIEDKHIMTTVLKNTLQSDRVISSAKLLVAPEDGTLQSPYFAFAVHRRGSGSSGHFHRRSGTTNEPEVTVVSTADNVPLGDVPWWDADEALSLGQGLKFMPEATNESARGFWSYPYFACDSRRWLLSYSCPIYRERNSHFHKTQSPLAGLFVIDIDLSRMDINQCDAGSHEENTESQIRTFLSTHRCDANSSKCEFCPGRGWTRGSYTCHCRDGFYSRTGKPIFNGTLVESAYRSDRITYSLLYVCWKCSPGCDTCSDESSCLSDYNWPFRIALLTISMLCILLTLLLMVYVYHYRKLKVIKVASPIFLCITLLGAVIMYLEMAAIFPVLDMYSCVATKWSRHLGFCITYSALLLKTWRSFRVFDSGSRHSADGVSLTYRVKSAHKIKLTDKQLLQWLFPILLVMVIYLSTWTVSSPPEGEYIKDFYGLKFKQCTYNWWDHCLAIGDVLFLLWGIKVCYNVRNAESLFNEAKHISYAIYNIAIVNTIMVAIHLMIFPNAPPDIKYLFGFIRTQLSTTVTIILVFGPKFHRVLKGQGDVYDSRARARGVTASFSLNGIGLMHEETPDLYQENEELKEEIQKLAAQIEFMKIVHMEMNNRHIKPRQGGYFSQNAVNVSHSPVAKAVYMKFESSDTPTSRISPAAELISERV